MIGAFKRGLAPLQAELGIHVCGKHSRRTPDELALLGDRVGLDGSALTRASRLVAKVDSAAVQDGFDLYLHGFFVTDDGRWTVVQQGMNGAKRQARRYHWHSEGLTSFVEAPHSAIDGPIQGNITRFQAIRTVPRHLHRADVSGILVGCLHLPRATRRQIPSSIASWRGSSAATRTFTGCSARVSPWHATRLRIGAYGFFHS